MGKQAARVSIIVPVYRAPKTIVPCVESILQQSYQHLEVWLVDDCSRDGSLALLRQFEAQDSRVRVIAKPQNEGVSAARNAALERATGTYIQFVDSDDCLPETAVADLLGAMGDDCDLVLGAYLEVAGGLRKCRGYLQAEQYLPQHDLLDRLTCHPNSFYYAALWNKLYRSQIIREGGLRFQEGLPWGEDFAFNMQYFRHIRAAAVLARPVYHYHRNINGLALSTGRMTLLRPLYAIRIKMELHQYYKQLFLDAGLYARYRHVLPQYLFRVTLSDGELPGRKRAAQGSRYRQRARPSPARQVGAKGQ